MRLILFSLFIFFSTLSIGQTNVGIKTVTVSGEKEINDALIETLASSILSDISDSKKDSLNKVLLKTLNVELRKKSAVRFSFSKVKSLTILTPSDSTFRLFNWNVPKSDGTHKYEAIILKKISGSKTKIIQLKQMSGILDKESMSTITTTDTNWIGAQYYNLIEKKTPFQSYYTLLAWDGNDLMTNKKHIEVLWFDGQGNPRFGAPIFKTNRETYSRIVFEFGGQNAMRLQYEDDLDRISFDHLSPPNNTLDGIFEYYGADFTYDCYQWDKNAWVKINEIYPAFADPKNRTSAKIRKSDVRFTNDDAINKKSIQKYKEVENPK